MFALIRISFIHYVNPLLDTPKPPFIPYSELFTQSFQ